MKNLYMYFYLWQNNRVIHTDIHICIYKSHSFAIMWDEMLNFEEEFILLYPDEVFLWNTKSSKDELHTATQMPTGLCRVTSAWHRLPSSASVLALVDGITSMPLQNIKQHSKASKQSHFLLHTQEWHHQWNRCCWSQLTTSKILKSITSSYLVNN